MSTGGSSLALNLPKIKTLISPALYGRKCLISRDLGWSDAPSRAPVDFSVISQFGVFINLLIWLIVFVGSVDQDQTGRNVQSDLTLHCPPYYKKC